MDLATSGYFKGVIFFRVVANFLTQFAHSPSYDLDKKFQNQRVKDDKPSIKPIMKYGSVFFAGISSVL